MFLNDMHAFDSINELHDLDSIPASVHKADYELFSNDNNSTLEPW